MMKKEKILVYDDESQRCQEYRNRLKSVSEVSKRFEVEPLKGRVLWDELKGLEERRTKLREGKPWGRTRLALDDVAIFVVDYDLLKASEFRGFLTSEVLAYLVRCFSSCGLIVAFNQFNKPGENVFDLTLKGHPESYADLNIADAQLSNPGLWGGERRDKFRPWHWPHLPRYLDAFKRKVKIVKERPDEPICRVLSIPDPVLDSLPRSVSEFIGDPHRVTFQEFVEKSGNGLRPKEGRPTPEMVARIGAARISKWLERIVLPGQDILVDAPHLVSRFPSLLTGEVKEVGTWNRTTHLDKHPSRLGLRYKMVEEFRFSATEWVSKPVWFWGKVSDCKEITEVSEPWKTKKAPYVFCEDTSKFSEEKKCREFVAETESPYARRYVCDLDEISYRPQVRFSL